MTILIKEHDESDASDFVFELDAYPASEEHLESLDDDGDWCCVSSYLSRIRK